MPDPIIDRRRTERGFIDIAGGGVDESIMLFQVASAITPATVATVPGTTPALIEITPTTFTVNVLGFVGSKLRTQVDPANPSNLQSMTLNNYDLSMKYSPPVDGTKAAFGVAILFNGTWIVLWVGC